jgi:BirA family biotin operon repressor/biotin-[acetyl-CoA-carboxylase] ligase
MDEARLLARAGAPHGAVIAASYQERGRGRTRERSWRGDAGKNLYFTILFRFEGGVIPEALTLRTGLAVSLAVEDYEPALKGRVRVKWPNDIMILTRGETAVSARKAAGILTESDGTFVYTGVGINVAQTAFPADLEKKATSIVLARSEADGPAPAPENKAEDTGFLLGLVLRRLYGELSGGGKDWRARIGERLYRRGEPVKFLAGAADRPREYGGVLEGVGAGGELLLALPGETSARAFITGELAVYDTPG